MSVKTTSPATATSTRQLTVNAAFLKEIKDDNQQLKMLWDQIVPIAGRVETVQNHWPELITLLGELRDQLAMHFSLEEAYGYFDDAVDIAPRLTTLAECLRSQHSKLFAQVRDLADDIDEADPDSEASLIRVVKRFGEFRQNFEAHEEAELKLILNAMGNDIGCGD